ncbi:flavin-containing monooxygenase [Colletotrichum kahawae]|uniref:Flavin-containing monooxygenase n=1 Tax=Colletotrichum kahawae TaxID=34407 RepID=A0AAD9YH06_COLKA|nr:flavin-containing monooxygenase [Colletotrichum kahawae]
MAPSTVFDHAEANGVDIAARATVKQAELNGTAERPPVADDYMYDFKYNHALPTTDVLGVQIPQDCDAQAEAEGIVRQLSDALGTGNAEAFADLFLEYGVWRDKLSFTWDQRTFNFRPAILKAARDLLPTTKASNFAFLTPAPVVDRPYDDFAQLQFVVSFETDLVVASAVIKAVLTKEGWKIYTMHTVAEQLKQFPERAPADGHMTGTISWEAQRAKEVDAADPEILIIGGGQNGLALAAWCKALGLNCLIVERSEEVGDVWKKRYEYLSLHFPHWADDLPFFRYPKQWPTYTPAQKQGFYMSWYASALELNIWTKSTVIETAQDDQGAWAVKINKGGNESRTVRPKHVLQGRRDPPLLRADPSEHDRLFFSTPVGPGEELGRRAAKVLEDLDRPLLDALNARGLRTWRGQRGTGNGTLGQTRNGGFYFDAGACEHIINGKIKVEPGYIERFTEDKVVLSGGRGREFDLVVFATGFSNLNDSIRDTLGPKVANQVGQVWGVDEEGEYRGAFRETGVKNLWIMVGFLPMTRFQSRILALRLKALTEGISPPPYKA